MLDVEVGKTNRFYTSSTVKGIERSKSGEKRLEIVIAHVSVSIRVRYFHPLKSPFLICIWGTMVLVPYS